MLILTALFALGMADCSTTAGRYLSLDNRDSQLVIGWDATFTSLSLEYPGHSEFYLPDGLVHRGDVFETGDTYTAACAPGVISLTRNFPDQPSPLDTEYLLRDGILIRTDNGVEAARYRPVTTSLRSRD